MKRENDTYVVSSTGLIGYPHGKCKRNLDLLFTWHKNEFYMELQVELYNEKKFQTIAQNTFVILGQEKDVL